MDKTIDFEPTMQFSDQAPAEWNLQDQLDAQGVGSEGYSDAPTDVTAGDLGDIDIQDVQGGSSEGYSGAPGPNEVLDTIDIGAAPDVVNVDAQTPVTQEPVDEAPLQQQLAKAEQAKVLEQQQLSAPIGMSTPPPAADKTASNLIDSLTKSIGDKGVAALIQGGFGMLAGASQGKMIEEKYKKEKQLRDAEWARKDKNAYAGAVKKTNWTGLLGTAAK